MEFLHSEHIWRDFPALVPGLLLVERITDNEVVDARLAELNAVGESRLSGRLESELPEIQAWRRAFSRMGLKPTQYRCAAESLLRRFKRERSLPRIHPLVDLCNAASLAFAIPVAAFDAQRIANRLEVRYADGSETYDAFSGETEHPEPHEVIFADDAGRAHARRWTNRQSAYSAVHSETTRVLVVAEALHDDAGQAIEELVASLAGHIEAAWSTKPKTAILDR